MENEDRIILQTVENAITLHELYVDQKYPSIIILWNNIYNCLLSVRMFCAFPKKGYNLGEEGLSSVFTGLMIASSLSLITWNEWVSVLFFVLWYKVLSSTLETSLGRPAMIHFEHFLLHLVMLLQQVLHLSVILDVLVDSVLSKWQLLRLHKLQSTLSMSKSSTVEKYSFPRLALAKIALHDTNR